MPDFAQVSHATHFEQTHHNNRNLFEPKHFFDGVDVIVTSYHTVFLQ
jgi:hypothetical protein